MDIQFNTDNNIEGKQSMDDYMTTTISEGLKHFGEHITRIEVHVSDENGNKKGPKDKKCVLEARLKGIAPIAVSASEDNVRKAVVSAVDKMKSSLTTTMGKRKN